MAVKELANNVSGKWLVTIYGTVYLVDSAMHEAHAKKQVLESLYLDKAPGYIPAVITKI